MIELKPKRSSFLFSRVSSAAIGAAVLAVALGVAAVAAEQPGLAGLGLLVWVVLVALSLWSGNVAWGKERYEIHDGHLVAHAGGLTSDRTIELDVKNITHVKQHLPWIRYRFFDVGDVIVQSAGSSSAEIVFRCVRDPDAVYRQIRELLKTNGFSVRGERLLHSEHPSTLGVVVECVSMALGGVFFAGWAAGGVAGAGAALGPMGLALGALGAGLMGLGAASFLVLHFLDMKRRTYEVYDDLVEYREGFLSRTNAFIPYENIADASTKQTLVDQVLGLYDVKVSCQGSGSEVAFRRLADGPQLQQVLRGRVDAAQALREREQTRARSERAQAPAAADAQAAASSRPPAELVPADQAWTAELRMNTSRAFLGGALLRALGTTYSVGPSSVSSRYSLIGQQQLEFAYDKVTGVQVRTGPLDDVFGTVTVRIWSIGSSTPLDLAHVERDTLDLVSLLRQAGVPGGPALETLPAEFGPAVWLRAHVVGVALLALALLVSLPLFVLNPALILVVVALAGPIGLSALFIPLLVLRYKRQLLTLHEHHMEYRSGVFWRRQLYARYDDVKKIAVRRYAGTCRGSLTVYVAGETQLQTSKGKSGAVVPNSFTAHYLADVTPFQQTMDLLLQGHVAPDAVTAAPGAAPEGLEFRPAVANSALGLALVGVLFPPLWLFMPLVVLSIRAKTYRVEAERAVIEEGVIYRTHTSVLFERIDSLKQGQGVLGKAFQNGTVTLFTAGSSRPDLVLSNTPEFKALYRAIRERYGG